MKYAEIKKNMTQGDWEIDNLAIRDSIYPQFCIATVNNNLENWEINQEAITTAVNNTYVKGIDPEAVSLFVDAAKLFLVTYADTDKNPTASQENDVVIVMREAFAAAEGKGMNNASSQTYAKNT